MDFKSLTNWFDISPIRGTKKTFQHGRLFYFHHISLNLKPPNLCINSAGSYGDLNILYMLRLEFAAGDLFLQYNRN